MVQSIANFSQQNPWGWAFGRHGKTSLEGKDAHGTRVTQKLFAIERTRATDLELTVQTDEGDTVTISLHNETDLKAIRYSYRSRGEEGKESLSLNARSLTVTQESSMEVEGSLSDQELADIEALVHRITGSLSDPAGGGTLPAAPDGANGGEFDSLAGYTMSLTQTQTVQMTALRLREWKPSATLDSAPPPPTVGPGPEVAEAPPESMPIDIENRPAGPQPIAAWILELLDQARAAAAAPAPVTRTPVEAA